jgi:NAD(P)-dependent dehydrogenase (short-subunit alcohol dehydrogenase family)
MEFRFDGKVVVITGGSSGMGEVTAKSFVKAGAKVIFADLNEPKQEGVEDYGDAEYYKADVTDPAAVERFAAYVDEKYGGADILFNNAGVLLFPLVPAHEVPIDVWRKTQAVNSDGVFFCAKYFLPHMMRKGKGAIVNTSSISGIGADFGLCPYNASKGAVANLTRNLAIDYAAHGIRVNAVAPGQIRTPMYEKGGEDLGSIDIMDAGARECYPMQRVGTPQEIANAVMFLASDYASFITGHNLMVDGGITAWTGSFHDWDRILKDFTDVKK